MVRIAVDAMGGEHAPGAVIRGAVQALAEVDCQLVLIGDESCIRTELDTLDGHEGRVDVVHCGEAIGMDEPPIEALRQKKDASLLRMAKMAAGGEVDVVISAGNSGAYAAACQLKMKPLQGVSRPGIAVTIPSFDGPFVLCDVGANIQAQPRHLYEYAVMASLYAEKVVDIENPRVGLMSIGQEDRKGNDLVKEARDLMAADSRLNFVGNIEGHDLFQNRCDVAVCDGFVGNIALKFTQSLAEGLLSTIARECENEPPEIKDRVQAALDRVWVRHDHSDYGAAPLLGVDGVCIMCYGRSDERAICNAVRAGEKFFRSGINESILTRLAG